MFLSSEPRGVLAYAEPVDLRKSGSGLVALVQSLLQEDSLSGCVFVFFNRRGNYLKLVAWDRTGYCLFAKRLVTSPSRTSRSPALCASTAGSSNSNP